MRRATIIVMLLAVAAASACGSENPTEAEPALGQIRPVRVVSDLILPLDSYGPSPEEEVSLSKAHSMLVRDCARRFGFTVTIPDESADAPRIGHARLFGIISLEEVSRFGYRLPADVEKGNRPSKTSEGWNPSDEEYTAVRGVDRYSGKPKTGAVINGISVPAGGCAGAADRTLAAGTKGSISSLTELIDKASLEAHRAAEGDRRVRSAFAAWSACMKRSGYSFGSPWEPNDKDWGTDVSPEEIATATADVKCRHETELVGTWLAAETAYQNRLIERREDELSRARQDFAVCLRNASKVLGG